MYRRVRASLPGYGPSNFQTGNPEREK